MKDKTIQVQILTPEATIFEGEALAVWLPGSICPFEVLPGHATLISSLREGSVTLRRADNSLTHIEIRGGIAKVQSNTIIVCVG